MRACPDGAVYNAVRIQGGVAGRVEHRISTRTDALPEQITGIALSKLASSMWLLLPVALLVTVAGVFWTIMAARPHLSWDLRRSDNQLTLTLVEGHGPLAGWLLSHSSIALGSQRGTTIVLSLPPGHTTVLHPMLQSVWPTTDGIAVSVPAQPVVVDSSVNATSATLHFSTPVTVPSTPCGLAPSLIRATALTVPRATTACTGPLAIVAANDERTVIQLAVPALPPPPAPPPPPPQPPNEVFAARGDGGAFYITIDDGWYPNNDVLNLMRQGNLPITAFLTSQAAALHLDYWRAFIDAGGDIEDHSVSHPFMTKLSATAVENEWTVAAQSMKSWFGTAPTMGRPPYGDVNATVISAAGNAGLHHVVMWTGYMLHGQLTTQDKRPLRAGEIILLHWTPEVYTDLQRLLALAAAQGLHPASLSAALG